MGFRRRFTLVLAGWVVALAISIIGLVVSIQTAGLGATRIVAALAVLGTVAGLWFHVSLTNRLLVRFTQSLRFGDGSTRFSVEQGAGFGELGASLDEAMVHVSNRQRAMQGDLLFHEALVDDMPVALLTADESGGITLANKAARRLFRDVDGNHAEDFAAYGATFAKHLAEGGAGDQVLLMIMGGMTQSMLVRDARLERLGRSIRAITVQPVQSMLNTAEANAQTDLVRVLTHEILNSLTPVTSLAQTAADLLDDKALETESRVADARSAVGALARRASGLTHFIEAYRTVARPPEVHRLDFVAKSWAEDIIRIFTAEAKATSASLVVDPEQLILNADADLLAQLAINLLRNAEQAMEGQDDAQVELRVVERGETIFLEVEDRGPGIPVALRQEVFLPFFTTRPNGSGVGLNLARQIATSHGGTIEVVDGLRGGALFRLALPRRDVGQ